MSFRGCGGITYKVGKKKKEELVIRTDIAAREKTTTVSTCSLAGHFRIENISILCIME